MVKLVNADKKSIIQGIKETLEKFDKIKDTTKSYNEVLSSAYNWDKVAHKTLQVYKKAMDYKDRSIITRMKKALGIGHVSGVFYLCLMALDYLLLMALTVFYPVSSFKKEKRFKYENYITYLKKLK